MRKLELDWVRKQQMGPKFDTIALQPFCPNHCTPERFHSTEIFLKSLLFSLLGSHLKTQIM